MTVEDFLQKHGWEHAVREPLAGDASSRRYIRLYSSPKRAILMIDPQNDTLRFQDIATHLTAVGLSAPHVMARTDSLMLLEDFGDAQFAKVIADAPDTELQLYTAAADVLCHLEAETAPNDLTIATPDLFGHMIEPVFSHYQPLVEAASMPDENTIKSRLTELLEKHLPKERVLILRDFHAENMIWLPDRTGVKKVGLLDFQDALVGPPIYDLVSLLQDARRDVSDTCKKAVIRHYLGQTGRSDAEFMPVFHLLGLQRNLRILGVFARLATERGKPGYLSLLPRVWGHIQTSLTAPVARDLRPLIEGVIPEPTAERLAKGAA